MTTDQIHAKGLGVRYDAAPCLWRTRYLAERAMHRLAISEAAIAVDRLTQQRTTAALIALALGAALVGVIWGMR